MEKKPFDDYASRYVKVHNQHLPPGVENAQFLAQKKQWVNALIEAQFAGRSGLRAIDFGCGVGSLCIELGRNQRVAEIAGVDESEESRELATAAMGGSGRSFRASEKVSQLPKSRGYDLITAFNVFHHVAPGQRRAIAQELIGTLADDGVLAIWEHNPWNPITRYLVKICPFDEGVTLLKRAEILALFDHPSLEVLVSEYVNFTPPSLQRFGFVRAIERLLAQIPICAQYRVTFRKKKAVSR